MSENYILLSGRPGTGKTKMLIAYANQYPKTTLMFSEEHTIEGLRKLGLDHNVDVVDKSNFDISIASKYDTICIDYIQVFDKNYIKEIIKNLMKTNIRIIAVSQMKPKSWH